MDEEAKTSQPPVSTTGGTVEPSNRGARTRGSPKKPHEAGERFELRDPFSEVTYHAKVFGEIAAKAETLGASRVTSISHDGKRTPLTKVGDQWQRSPSLNAQPERPLDLGPARGDRPDDGGMNREQAGSHHHGPQEPGIKGDASSERAALVTRLEATLHERYIIKHAAVNVGNVPIGSTEYRFRGDSSRVAFTETAFKLATDTNSPSVARSMVDVAQARGWSGLRVSGNEDFRRLVWLEASVRGVKAIGYEPNPADLDVLRREQQARQTNRIEPAHDGAAGLAMGADKPSVRGGRKVVIAAIEALLIAQRVPEAKRNAVLAAATEKLAERASLGQRPKIKVYDLASERSRPVPASSQDAIQVRDRAVAPRAR